jgi:hypothetical protein
VRGIGDDIDPGGTGAVSLCGHARRRSGRRRAARERTSNQKAAPEGSARCHRGFSWVGTNHPVVL